MPRLGKPSNRLAIAARLAELRDELGKTQEGMAADLSLSAKAYRNYEQGLRDLPGQVYFTIYEVFDVDPLWLHSGVGLGPKLRHRGREIDLWKVAAVAVGQAVAEAGLSLDDGKYHNLLQAVVDHMKGGGDANPAYVASLVKLVA